MIHILVIFEERGKRGAHMGKKSFNSTLRKMETGPCGTEYTEFLAVGILFSLIFCPQITAMLGDKAQCLGQLPQSTFPENIPKQNPK